MRCEIFCELTSLERQFRYFRGWAFGTKAIVNLTSNRVINCCVLMLFDCFFALIVPKRISDILWDNEIVQEKKEQNLKDTIEASYFIRCNSKREILAVPITEVSLKVLILINSEFEKKKLVDGSVWPPPGGRETAGERQTTKNITANRKPQITHKKRIEAT